MPRKRDGKASSVVPRAERLFVSLGVPWVMPEMLQDGPPKRLISSIARAPDEDEEEEDDEEEDDDSDDDGDDEDDEDGYSE